MTPPPFIVTGTGRSGTLWAAQVLRVSGMAVGHQSVFRHETVLGRPWKWGHHHGDCSFEAVPMLEKVDAVKVLLIRHPLKVIRSWRGLGLFVDKVDTWQYWGLLSRVLDRYFPDVLSHPDPIGRAALFWLRWNEFALRHCDVMLMLEGLAPVELYAAIRRPNRYRSMADAVATDTNSRADEKVDRGPHGWDEIPDPVRGWVQELAEKVGYEE